MGSLKLRLRLARRRLRRPSSEQLTDGTFLAGLAAITAGCGWIFPPAAPIIGGCLLTLFAWVAGRDTEPAEKPPRTVETWYSDPDQPPAEDA